MNTNVNRVEILKQVEAGQLSAADAAAQLASPRKPALSLTKPDGKPRWLHVRVTDLDTGRPKVMVNLPMSLVQAGLSIGSHFAPELDGLDWQTIAEALNSETDGQLVEVEDVEDGQRVQVYVD
jgi:hypothetical protein